MGGVSLRTQLAPRQCYQLRTQKPLPSPLRAFLASVSQLSIKDGRFDSPFSQRSHGTDI